MTAEERGKIAALIGIARTALARTVPHDLEDWAPIGEALNRALFALEEAAEHLEEVSPPRPMTREGGQR